MGFHSGEILVQERAGVTRAAKDVGEGILDFIPPRAGEFVAQQAFAIAASVHPGGAVWASVIAGAPGFMQVTGARSLVINSMPAAGDPLIENLPAQAHIALIMPELSAPRRVRLNGVAWIADGAIQVRTAQVYANCPRYIQKRRLAGAFTWAQARHSQRASMMSPKHRALIAKADTFFIATDHPEAGADVSHKGGNPGFVKVVSDRRLAFPDYNGNSMFNTLGNIAINPAAGLLFIDFETGRTLQLTGRAGIDWNQQRSSSVKGAERMVDFELDEIIYNSQGFPLRYELVRYSPYNPA